MKTLEIINETTVKIDGVEYAKVQQPEAGLDFDRILTDTGAHYLIDPAGKVQRNVITYPNQYPTERAAKQASARIKLEVVAHYLNEGWERGHERAFYWAWHSVPQRLDIGMYTPDYWAGSACFKTHSLAERARAILGDEIIKQSLGIFD
jgi:hypothetical protein